MAPVSTGSLCTLGPPNRKESGLSATKSAVVKYAGTSFAKPISLNREVRENQGE